MYKLKKEFKLTKKDFQRYTELQKDKPNSPDTKLNKKEIEFVNNLYYRYIVKTIENRTYEKALYTYYRDNWMSGHRTKKHESKRIILSSLIELNRRGNLTNKDASSLFFSALGCVKHYQVLLNYAMEVK